MSRTKNSRKGKVSMPKHTSLQKSTKIRAEKIIRNNGSRIGFMSGMAFTEVQIIGMEELVNIPGVSKEFKVNLVHAIQDNLRTKKRTWTLVVAFISEVDGNTTIDTVSKVFRNTTPSALDKDGTDWMYKQSETLWNDTTFCSLWITLPCEADDADGIFEEFDAELEATSVFDRDKVAKLTSERMQIAALKASIKCGGA